MSDQCSGGARFQLSEDYLRTSRQYEDEWAELAAGIVLFAFKEYVETLFKLIILTDDKKQQQYEAMKKEIETFFRGPWYTMLTAINPEWVIREAQEQAMTKALRHLERQTIREMKNVDSILTEEAML